MEILCNTCYETKTNTSVCSICKFRLCQTCMNLWNKFKCPHCQSENGMRMIINFTGLLESVPWI